MGASAGILDRRKESPKLSILLTMDDVDSIEIFAEHSVKF